LSSTVRTQTNPVALESEPTPWDKNSNSLEKSEPESPLGKASSVSPDWNQTISESSPLETNKLIFQRDALSPDQQTKKQGQVEAEMISASTTNNLLSFLINADLGNQSPWITSGGEFDCKFFEYVQNKAEQLPEKPLFPSAVAKKMILEHGQWLWADYQRYRRSQAQIHATRSVLEEQRSQVEDYLNTREGRLRWLLDLWDGPCRFRAKAWIENEGKDWGFTFDSNGYPSDPKSPA
jgi:hypothetical protein